MMIRYPLSTGTLVIFIKLNRKLVEVKKAHVFTLLIYYFINQRRRMPVGGWTPEKKMWKCQQNVMVVLIDVRKTNIKMKTCKVRLILYCLVSNGYRPEIWLKTFVILLGVRRKVNIVCCQPHCSFSMPV